MNHWNDFHGWVERFKAARCCGSCAYYLAQHMVADKKPSPLRMPCERAELAKRLHLKSKGEAFVSCDELARAATKRRAA